VKKRRQGFSVTEFRPAMRFGRARAERRAGQRVKIGLGEGSRLAKDQTRDEHECKSCQKAEFPQKRSGRKFGAEWGLYAPYWWQIYSTTTLESKKYITPQESVRKKKGARDSPKETCVLFSTKLVP